MNVKPPKNTLLQALATRRVLVASLVLLAVALVWLIVVPRLSRAADPKAGEEPGPMFVRQGDRLTIPERSPLRSRLAVAPVRELAAPHAVTFPGTVEADPAYTANILPPLTGRLVALKVKLGDAVRQNQVLAEISSPDLAQAYADVDKARDALGLAERALERARGVNGAGANATKDIEQADSNRVQAQAEFNRARDRLKALGAGEAGTSTSRSLQVTAPMAGIVTSLNVSAGSFVNDATAALMTIANLDHVWVTANVPENLAGMVAKGQSVDVTLPAYPDQVLHGTVSFVAAVLDPDTRRVKARISFANPGNKLLPNMYASVVAAVPQDRQIAVPPSALLMNNDSTTVFVEVAPWTFERRTVEPGTEDNDSVRIRSGLSGSEKIIVRGGVLLND